MTNLTNKKPGGYQSLIVYHQAVLIFDLTHEFCKQFLEAIRDQREQAKKRQLWGYQ